MRATNASANKSRSGLSHRLASSRYSASRVCTATAQAGVLLGELDRALPSDADILQAASYAHSRYGQDLLRTLDTERARTELERSSRLYWDAMRNRPRRDFAVLCLRGLSINARFLRDPGLTKAVFERWSVTASSDPQLRAEIRRAAEIWPDLGRNVDFQSYGINLDDVLNEQPILDARGLFQTTCANCGETAKVPFQPRPDRAVYCSRCFEHIESALVRPSR